MLVKIFGAILLMWASISFACEANCVACHPSLEKNGLMDSDHQILRNCVNCHTAKEDEVSHDACGADCWSCHDVQKISHMDVPEHRVLSKCIACHVSLDKELFNFKENKNIFSNNTVKNQLVPN